MVKTLPEADIDALSNSILPSDRQYMQALIHFLATPPKNTTQEQYDTIARLALSQAEMAAAKREVHAAEQRLLAIADKWQVPVYVYSNIGASNTYWPESRPLEGLENLGIRTWLDLRLYRYLDIKNDDQDATAWIQALCSALHVWDFENLDTDADSGEGWAKSFC